MNEIRKEERIEYVYKGYILGAATAFLCWFTDFLLNYDATWVGVVLTVLWFLCGLLTITIIYLSQKDDYHESN